MTSNLFILTGAMGSGKTTIVESLKLKGFNIVDEPARQILAEQRLFAGNGVPENDPQLFTELMLSRSLYFYNKHKNTDKPVLFDRGVPDMIAYASLFNLDLNFVKQAAQAYRYNKYVFITAGWEEIYQTDDERTMSYQEAEAFGQSLRTIYQELDYNLIEVPQSPAQERSEYILSKIKEFPEYRELA